MTRPPAFTKAQRLDVYERHGAIVLCQNCGDAMYLRDPTTKRRCDIDHWLAWVDGGAKTHKRENWRPLCKPCHMIKSAKETSENARAKRRHAKHFGHDDKPKRTFAKGQPLRGRSEWPKCHKEWPSRLFPNQRKSLKLQPSSTEGNDKP